MRQVLIVAEPLADECPTATPRADALANSGLPYYFTFETNEAGLLLTTFSENQGVDISYSC